MSRIGMSPRSAAAVAVVLALVVYLPSLSNGFALDDTGDIVENTTVHGLANTGEILTSPYRGRVPPGRSPYRPVTSLTYALNWSMGSGSPVPFHAFNVALHGANTALVTILLTTLGASPLLALLGAAVFAVHPVHVEAVANSVGRGDALMALFVLLGALAYLRRSRSEWARVGLVSLAYAMALASKENGVVLPALLVVLSLLFPRRAGRATQLPVFAALAGVLVVYLAVRYQVLGTLLQRDAAPYIVMLPPWLRISTAVANITELTRLFLFSHRSRCGLRARGHPSGGHRSAPLLGGGRGAPGCGGAGGLEPPAVAVDDAGDRMGRPLRRHRGKRLIPGRRLGGGTHTLSSIGGRILSCGGPWAVCRRVPARITPSMAMECGRRDDAPRAPRRCTNVDEERGLARHGSRLHDARRGTPRVLPSSVVDGHAADRRWRANPGSRVAESGCGPQPERASPSARPRAWTPVGWPIGGGRRARLGLTPGRSGP